MPSMPGCGCSGACGSVSRDKYRRKSIVKDLIRTSYIMRRRRYVSCLLSYKDAKKTLLHRSFDYSCPSNSRNKRTCLSVHLDIPMESMHNPHNLFGDDRYRSVFVHRNPLHTALPGQAGRIWETGLFVKQASFGSKGIYHGKRKPAMNISYIEFDRVVLEAVSEDYESFESVVSKLSRLNNPILGLCEIERIERSLLSSIDNNLVSAYLIHAEPPYATIVVEKLDSIRSYWFCLTEEGKAYLHRPLGKRATTGRRALSQVHRNKSTN